MSKQIRVISDSDWEVLKRLVASNQNLQQAAPQRPNATGQYLDGDDSMSPEVYIALPPDEGIPALLSVTTGTGSGISPMEGDLPGSAICSIYKITEGELKPIVGLTRRVYNLTSTSIARGWITVLRDKSGKWLASVGGGGCESQNAILQITVIGKPTGGSFTISLSVNEVIETVTISYNLTASQVVSAIVTDHSGVTSINYISGSGGPLPNATVSLEFVDVLGNLEIPVPGADWTSLTGGSGVAVICSLAQKGHA